MRILGFSKKWHKLEQDEFTTFRFTRKDKDWGVGEQVKVVYKPRQKGGGEFMGVAEIKNKEPRSMSRIFPIENVPIITNEEAIADGFPNGSKRYRDSEEGYYFMLEWLYDNCEVRRLLNEPMNKLTLKWMQKGA